MLGSEKPQRWPVSELHLTTGTGSLAFLTQVEHQRRPDMQQAPLDIIPAAWRCLVLPQP